MVASRSDVASTGVLAASLSEIVREALGAGEIDRLLATVDRRLEDASLESLHAETRLEQACHAILGCAVIGLRVHGLRTVDRPGHHVVALESLADTVGVTLDRIDYFQTLRNKDLYTGSAHVSASQVAEARQLASDTRRWLASRGSRAAG